MLNEHISFLWGTYGILPQIQFPLIRVGMLLKVLHAHFSKIHQQLPGLKKEAETAGPPMATRGWLQDSRCPAWGLTCR